MNNADFNELAGRIEGLSRAYLLLGSMLQRQGAIDEQLLQANLRNIAGELAPDLSVAARTMNELADVLLHDHMQNVRGLSPQQIEAALMPVHVV